MSEFSRRRFLSSSAVVAAGGVVAGTTLEPHRGFGALSSPGGSFESPWNRYPDRVWLGPEVWANPLQDWQIAGGRAECTNPAIDRNVQVLTHDLSEAQGDLHISVRVGRVGNKRLSEGRGSVGFRIGIQGPLREYRNSLIFGAGLNAGLTAAGGLFIGNIASAKDGVVDLARNEVQLKLVAVRHNAGYRLTLSAIDPQSQQKLGEVSRDNLPAEQLVGNLGLVANYGTTGRGPGTNNNAGAGTGLFWFTDWNISGSKVTHHAQRSYGPILFSQYTLSRGVLKITAQMPPLGKDDTPTVGLMVKRGDSWQEIVGLDPAPIAADARTATFKIENWDATRDVPYRLSYLEKLTDGQTRVHEWTGVIRRDPIDQDVLTVADISCNIHAAFPNHEYLERAAKLRPDFLAFTGDQFYESTGGYGVVRQPVDKAIVDYLRKWYMHGWTWRELMRDRPSISIPDDHDVYQGNIWGLSGAPQTTTQEAGGYQMDARWVNVVHRTQTSHHPDPYDPTPIQQNISVYYGPLTYGRVSFAVLADRMFKTAPEGVVPPTGGRGDHVIDPNFDPQTADLPGLQLLGSRQMKFLTDWVTDWRGADMKAVISQTIFTAMATTHGGTRDVLRADYDTNGWPQSARNEALRLIRKAFAVHLAGDQHLPAVVHYGVDDFGDAGVAFAGPAVNVGYPRWWEPKAPGQNRREGASELTGDFLDHFGNKLTVLAVKNGAVTPQGTILEVMEQKASGLGVVRFDKRRQKITIECWPYLADPTQAGTQFPGWPIEIDVLANYGRQAKAYLPTLDVAGMDNPVVQVIDESNGELVYALRVAGNRFRPHVFAEGKYMVRVLDPENNKSREFPGLSAKAKQTETLRVEL